MKFSVKLHNELRDDTLMHCVLHFLDPLIPPRFQYIDRHHCISTMFFDHRIGRINLATFGAALTFRWSGVSESALH